MKISNTLIASILFFSLLGFACKSPQQNDQSEIVFKAFPNTINIVDLNYTKSIPELNPSAMFSIDSLILIHQRSDSEFFFSVFDCEMNQLGSFAKRGKGPGEFTYAECNGQYTIDEAGRIQLWIHDQNSFKAYKIDLQEAMETPSDDSFIKEIIKIPTNLLTIPEIIINEKDQLAYGRSDMVSKGRFLKFSNTGEEIEWLCTCPNVEEIAHVDNYKLAYHGTTRYDANQNAIISAMTHFPRIDFFNGQGKLYKSIIRDNGNPQPDLLDQDKPFKDGNYNYYYDVQLSENYIFASNRNKTFGNTEPANKEVKTSVEVFKLDGTPVAELFFPTKVFEFAISMDEKWLYTIDYYKEDMPILVYKLPEL